VAVSFCETCGAKFRSEINSIGSVDLIACSPKCELPLRLDMLGSHHRHMLTRLHRTDGGPEQVELITQVLEKAKSPRDLREVRRMVEEACREEGLY
jgi:hypothetical protein